MNKQVKALVGEGLTFAGIMTVATIGWLLARQVQRHVAPGPEEEK